MGSPLLALVVVNSSNIETLKTFYEKLGFEFQQEQHGKGPVHYSSMLGNTVFEIYPLYEGESVDRARFGFRIDDLDGRILKLTCEGIQIVSQPKQTRHGFRAVVKDPDGRIIELYQK